MLSQKTVQHEAVLATLAALSHPPAPERLYPSLRPSLPQLLGLGQLRDGAWAGSLPPPAGLDAAVAQARAQGRPVTLPVDAARYWLVAPSSWSLLLDARQLLQDGDVPDALANLTCPSAPSRCACWRARTPARTAGRCRCRNRWAPPASPSPCAANAC